MVIVLCSIARCIIFGVPRLPVRPCDERPPAMYGHFCLVPRVSVHDRYYCIGETGVVWDKFWLGQCPSVLNDPPDCDTNDVFGEHLTTAFTGATRNIDARFASEIAPKNTFWTTKVDYCLCVSNKGWNASDKAHYGKGLYDDDVICMA